MEVLSIDAPIHRVPYELLNAKHKVQKADLPITLARADKLPQGVEALVLAADLQGRVRAEDDTDGILLGMALAADLEVLAACGEIPPLSQVGVILAGDMFVEPGLERRGGHGDVRDVWRAFSKTCRWVAGVAGNHDIFSEKPSAPALESFKQENGIHLLDGEIIELDGLRIGGLSGVMAESSRKPFRRTAEAFRKELAVLDRAAPDILVIHEAPTVSARGIGGNQEIEDELSKARSISLVVCGHKFWHEPMAQLANGLQILNVNSRCLVLTAH